MGMEDARQAMINRLETDWAVAFPGVDLFYENATGPNLAQRTAPFMQVDFDLAEGRQMELSPNPRKRVYALAFFAIFQKEGTGTKTINLITDHLIQTFGAVNQSQYTTLAVVAVKAPAIPGWYGKAVRVDFYYPLA